MAHPTRNFKTPEELGEVWIRYKADLKEKSKQWEKVQYVGKDGYKVTDYPKLPLTLEGLKRFCFDQKIGCIEQYFTNQDKDYNDFLGICSRIKTEIREDQITGGMMGFYNPSITQRLNNLKEQTETNSTHNVNILNIDPLSDSE